MFQFSRKQLLAPIALLALAVVSLKYASAWWLIGVGMLSVVVFFAALILALVARHEKQACGIGVATVLAAYFLLVAWQGALFPTSRLLDSLHGLMVTEIWTITATGMEVSEAEATSMLDAWRTPPVTGRSSQPNEPVTQHERPDRSLFVQMGHYWFALIFALIGGLFAWFVYRQRIEAQSPAENGLL